MAKSKGPVAPKPKKEKVKAKTKPQPQSINGAINGAVSKSSVSKVDDFVLTISDSDDLPDSESDIEAPSDEEAPKTLEISGTEAHAARGTKRKREDDALDRKPANGDKKVQKEDKKKRENEDMNSDFEFQTGDLDGGDLDDLEGWGFNAPGMKADKKGVDIDDIISRRNAKSGKAAEIEIEEVENDDEEMADDESAEDEKDEEFMGLEDDEDNEDGFGAGAESADDEDEVAAAARKDNDNDGEDEEETNSDDESVASTVDHPLDTGAIDSGASSASESEAEAAAKAAFFAPAEPVSTSSTSFQQMTLSRPILRGLSHIGFATPTAIQSSTIPVALLGRDIVGGAVTGSGKTAAYMVPILERLLYRPKKVPTSRVVVLCPTRELAIQVHSVAVKLAAFTDIKFCLAVGGLSLKVQEAELRLRPDIVIATPGRFIDHMRNSVSFNTDAIEILVLDEADRMLEDGFADELNEILKTLPKSRQTMLFSATMTDTVDKLVRIGMQKPVRLMVDNKKSTVATLTQEFIRIRHGREGSRLAMLMILVKEHYKSKCIVFFRSKVFAHKVRVIFGLCGLKAAELHGSLSQEQRIRAVENFRDGKVDFLLATDLASRGLDIRNVSYVINLELPQSHEIYLHRVGRTARAGRTGRSCTLAAESDRKIVRAAVKAAQAQKGKVVSRTLDQAKIETWMAKLDDMEKEIEEVLEEEQMEKKIQAVEMQLAKGQNLIKHEAEIASRPRRTWFESEADKKTAKDAGAVVLNGEKKGKPKGKLSGKKQRKLESHGDQKGDGERVYKKTKVERVAGSKRGVKVGAQGSGKTKPKNVKKFGQKMGKGKRR